MSRFVYLNNQIVPQEKAKISVFDHGFLYGDGLFDTMRAYSGRVFRQEQHLDRLQANARCLALTMPWSREELTKAIQTTIQANNLSEAYIRLTISRGPGPIGIDPRLCPQPTLVIMAKELTPFPEDTYTKGIATITLNIRRNPIQCLDPSLKSLNFLNNILAKLELINTSISEGIMLNCDSVISEGTISNIFWVSQGGLYTPSPEVGILLGITRQTVLEISAEAGIMAHQGAYTVEQLYQADECFFTNSSGELMPVTQVDGQVIGDGKPGPVTRRLHELYREIVARQTNANNLITK